MSSLTIAFGSAIGGVTRYWASLAAARAFGEAFPYGTLGVNFFGSVLIGFLYSLSLPTTPRQFLMAGFCGGFTTFSTFSLETMNLARAGQLTHAAWNVLLSAVLCLVGVYLGNSVGRT